MTFQIIGFNLPQDICSELSDEAYDRAGIMTLEEYYDVNRGSAPKGDPLGEAFCEDIAQLNSNFSKFYKKTTEDTIESDLTENRWVYFAGYPQDVYSIKEKFDGAKQIEETDLRTVHTKLFRVALQNNLFSSEANSDIIIS